MLLKIYHTQKRSWNNQKVSSFHHVNCRTLISGVPKHHSGSSSAHLLKTRELRERSPDRCGSYWGRDFSGIFPWSKRSIQRPPVKKIQTPWFPALSWALTSLHKISLQELLLCCCVKTSKHLYRRQEKEKASFHTWTIPRWVRSGFAMWKNRKAQIS